jgi:hypothetical protein
MQASGGMGAVHLWTLRAITGRKESLRAAKIQKHKESMARPRTPTAVLKLRGAFINHPSRGRDREFEPRIATGLPAPPKNLDSATSKMWQAMQSRGYWLTSGDRFLVEIAAALMARYRIDQLKSGDVSQLIGLLSKIGFSPSERGKMNLSDVRTSSSGKRKVSMLQF